MIKIRINIRKDAWNWWHACNKISYGVDWGQRVSARLRNKIKGKTKKEAFRFLIPYLKKTYRLEDVIIEKTKLVEVFSQKGKEIFSRMAKVTGKKIYRNNFTCYLTTFPRAPYNFEKGFVWIPIVWPQETCTRTFVHELLHFQTYAYWQKVCLKQINWEQFEDLKEALTIVLNEEFLDLIVWRDKGYECHKKIRMKLQKYWKENKNFDALIKYGIKLLK